MVADLRTFADHGASFNVYAKADRNRWMDHSREVHASVCRGILGTQLTRKRPRRPGKSQLGMVADEKRPVSHHRRRKLAGDYRARSRLQRSSKMLLILNKDKIVSRRRFDAGHAVNLGAAIPDHTGSHGLGNLLQRTLHRSHCIAAGQVEERAVGKQQRET